MTTLFWKTHKVPQSMKHEVARDFCTSKTLSISSIAEAEPGIFEVAPSWQSPRGE